MKPFTLRTNASLLTILVAILLSLFFYKRYSKFEEEKAKSIVDFELAQFPRHPWREYMEEIKEQINTPLKEKIQIFGLSTKINVQTCLSIKTALLAGYQYQLIGPTILDSIMKKLHYKAFNLIAKWILISAVLEKLPDDVVLVPVDTFDVSVQMDPSTFLKKYTSFLDNNKEFQNKVMFNSEVNCFPFNSYSNTYRCLKYSGEEHYNHHLKNSMRSITKPNTTQVISLGCAKQEALSKERKLKTDKYLNSGVSIGTVSSYKSLLAAFWHEVSNSPLGCMDDQGFVGWIYGNQLVNITLDYDGYFVDSKYKQDFTFNNHNGMFGRQTTVVDKEEEMNYPFLIHHNGDKSKLVYMVKTLSDWNKKKSVDKDDSTFYINGVAKKYVDVCGVFGDADIEAWDKKIQKLMKKG